MACKIKANNDRAIVITPWMKRRMISMVISLIVLVIGFVFNIKLLIIISSVALAIPLTFIVTLLVIFYIGIRRKNNIK